MSVPLLRPDWPAPPRVHAIATTRKGGFSRGAWRSFNLGIHCGDEPAAVQKNRDLLSSLLPGPPQWLHQVHSSGVICHPGVAVPETEGDALVSFEAGRVCAVLTADCLPVVFCNRQGTRVAVAHAGWRGLAAGVLEATLEAMNEEPQEVMAWLGPAIGPGAYQVGNEVREAFITADQALAAAFKPGGRRWMLDLYEAARLRLHSSGVSAVYGGEYCTWSEPERFFSYRRDGITGRMACVVWLE